jgi:hypothetical protein
MPWKYVGIKMPPEVRLQLDALAKADDVSLSAWIRAQIARAAQHRLQEQREEQAETS